MPHRTPRLALLLATSSILTLAAEAAHAAALERAVPSPVRLLFEKGSYAEIGMVYSDPHQSGEGANLQPLLGTPFPVPVAGNTGDVFDGYWSFNGAWKSDINDKLSYVLAIDQPYGADTSYGKGTFPGAPGFTYKGTAASLTTWELSGVLAYDPVANVKLYAGLRAQWLDADAAIPFVGPTAGLPGYGVNADPNWGYGYLVGAAYYRSEIAMRVALTYLSSIRHDLSTTEFGGIAIPGIQSAGNTETDVDMPQSVALEFQTGVTPKTLVFGSVRWVDWSDFTIDPPSYEAVTGRPLVEYEHDWWTYTAGVGQQLTDALAGSLTLSYEPSVGGTMTSLGPYDGRTLLTAALSYDIGRANLTGGLTYGKLGDTENILQTDFNDGSVWGAGLRLGYSF